MATWLTPAQLELFDGMHRADQRHGLDVVAVLRASGHDDLDLLAAGLLHDCGKGRRLHIWHRVGWSLIEPRSGLKAWLLRVPTFREAFATIAAHAQKSAELAQAAGCSPSTVELIRHQSEPSEDDFGHALRLADEAS